MADLRQLYGFDFPDDLHRVWDLARRVRPLEPLHAFEETLHLRLVGPFDVLAGRFDRHTPRYPISQHWRCPQDPPELFTVFAGSSGLHWGYWIDVPGESIPCVVAVYPDQGFEPDRYGDDLLTALRLHLEELAEESEDDMTAARERLFGAAPVSGEIGKKTRRDAAVIARTGDGLGIVAPPGTYRPLTVSDRVLSERIWEEEPPADLIAEAYSAADEGFPATALKLGRELWAVPEPAHLDAACKLLDRAYAGLGRTLLRDILADQRRHGEREWLDILEQEAHDRDQ
jgi:hypothetical protein